MTRALPNYALSRRRVLAGLVALLAALPVLPGLARAQGPAATPPSVAAWDAEWTGVLQRRVDEKGRIDFKGLAADRAALDKVVAFVATHGPAATPDLFPTLAAKLAYYLNAYNALAMKGILDDGIPEDFGMLGRFQFFYLQKFEVDGGSISLYDLENDVIRPLGEPRVHFALNCMVRGCPRLPRTAFTAAALDEQLDQAARLFVSETRNVRLDTAAKTVHLSAIFDFYTKDFLAKAPSLIAYVNRFRTDKVPAAFEVAFIDYDWTVNIQ